MQRMQNFIAGDILVTDLCRLCKTSLCAKASTCPLPQLRRFLLPYTEYPWFRRTRIEDVLAVELSHEDHLRWPALDVDLSIGMLEEPAACPLKYT